MSDIHVPGTAEHSGGLKVRHNTMSSLLAYRFRGLFLLIFLFLYPTLAFFGPHQERAEFYPFFSWNLFAHSSNSKSDAVLLVREIDGRRIDPPWTFYELTGEFAAARSQDIRLAKMLDNYVYAVLSNSESDLQPMKSVIENRFLADKSDVRYDIAVITYDPIQRYKVGVVNDIRVIASNHKVAP